jgi:hypothetical protein
MLRRGRFGPSTREPLGFTRRLTNQGQSYLGFLPLVVHEKRVLLTLPFKPSRAPFGPSVRDVAAKAYLFSPPFGLRSASLALPAPYLLRPLLTSAPRSACLATPSVPTSGQQCRSPEVSLTAFATHPPDLPPRLLMAMDFAVIGPLVQAGRPRIWFLYVRSWLGSTLPSDLASRRRPCASLILHHHQVG